MKPKKKKITGRHIACAAVAAVLLYCLTWVIFSWLPFILYRDNMRVKPQGTLDSSIYYLEEGNNTYTLQMPGFFSFHGTVYAGNFQEIDNGYFIHLFINIGFGGKKTAYAEFSNVDASACVRINVLEENGYMPSKEELAALSDSEKLAICDQALDRLAVFSKKLPEYCNLDKSFPSLRGLGISLKSGGVFAALASLFIFFDIIYAAIWFRYKKSFYARSSFANADIHGKTELTKDGLVFTVTPPVCPMFNGMFSVTLPYDTIVPDKLAYITEEGGDAEDKPPEIPVRYSLEIVLSLKHGPRPRIKAQCPEITHEKAFYIDRSLNCLPDSELSPIMRVNNELTLKNNKELFNDYLKAAVRMWGYEILGD